MSQNSASDRMTVKGGFPLKNLPFWVFLAGQNLTLQEMARLNGDIDRVQIGYSRDINSVLLVTRFKRSPTAGTNEQEKVGKGMITHLLPGKAALNDTDSLVILARLTPDAISFASVSSDGRRDPSKGAVYACNGLLTEMEVWSIPPRVK